MSRDKLAAIVVIATTVLMCAIAVFDGFVFYKKDRHYDVPVWLVTILTGSASGAVYWAFRKK